MMLLRRSVKTLMWCSRDKQLEAIKCFCAGHDVFVSLPTGYGKSLIYAVLPLIFDRIKGKCLINVINVHRIH